MHDEHEIWLRTDEIDQFIDALEHSADLATSVDERMMRWKWLIFALHNALQGACTCALRGNDTAGISMLSNGKAVWKYLDVTSRKDLASCMPEPRLDRLTELYERVQNEQVLGEPFKLPANEQMNKDVEQLNTFRNWFMHFPPHSWSVEVSGMPRIVRNCCAAIEHLAVKHPSFWHKLGDAHSEALDGARTALSRIRTEMDAWEKRQLPNQRQRQSA